MVNIFRTRFSALLKWFRLPASTIDPVDYTSQHDSYRKRTFNYMDYTLLAEHIVIRVVLQRLNCTW